MAKKKTAAELRAELRILRTHGVGNNITKVVRDLIMYGSFVSIGYFTYMSIDSLSGKITQADISVKAGGSVSIDTDDTETGLPAWYKGTLLLAFFFGAGGIAYGRGQAKLRKDVIQRYHPTMQEAERNIDDKRSSSDLTERGNTRPEDI